MQDGDNENEQEYKDALQLLIENSRRSDEPFSLQVAISKSKSPNLPNPPRAQILNAQCFSSRR